MLAQEAGRGEPGKVFPTMETCESGCERELKRGFLEAEAGMAVQAEGTACAGVQSSPTSVWRVGPWRWVRK